MLIFVFEAPIKLAIHLNVLQIISMLTFWDDDISRYYFETSQHSETDHHLHHLIVPQSCPSQNHLDLYSNHS